MRKTIHQLANHIDNSILSPILILSIIILPMLVAFALPISNFQALLIGISLLTTLIVAILGIIICAVDITYKD